MSTTRPFALNTGSTISGTTQIGSIAIGTSALDYSLSPGGVQWWMGPDEDLGYIITAPDLTYSQLTPVGINAGIRFKRSVALTDASFISLVNFFIKEEGYSESVSTAIEAKAWLDSNGYPTSWESSPSPGPIYDGSTIGWYDSSDLTTITKDGSNIISDWRDKLGNGWDLDTTTRPPQWTSDGVLFISGTTTNTWIQTSDNGLEQPFTIHILFKPVSLLNYCRIFSNNNNTTPNELRFDVVPNAQIAAGSTINIGSPFEVDKWYLFSYESNGASTYYQINASAKSDINPGINPLGKLTLNARSTGVNGISQLIPEIIVRGKIDSAEDYNSIRSYINSKYSLWESTPMHDGSTVGWYDSSDLTTITKDASNYVSRWRDKLGSGRDLLQGTGSKQPLYQSTGIYFDGVDNFMKTAPFTWNQPEMIYAVLKQVSWILNEIIWDGNTIASMYLQNRPSTPSIALLCGFLPVANGGLTLGEFKIIRALYNGTGSKLTINLGTTSTGNPGSASASAFTLGTNGVANSGFTEIEVKEIILRNVVDSDEVQGQIYSYLSDKYSI